ncbi:hypothetical protein [Neomegalonema sp.]|uniref:hypothetical protein n=1 Tax=Neomegalonema sp. TaxID=2039713 RepID=UPI0026359220|nr:hypothetical protein [Neomegalonema sp.]MDD2867027.1 hypothetical protein [Neomegalonema sp.]
MNRVGILVALLTASLIPPAAAEGWVVMDLGETATREVCMSRAESVLNGYISSFGGHSVEKDSWTVYGYDLKPGDNDVLVMCPVVNGGKFNAFLTVYGAFEDSQEDFTDTIAERLKEQWDNAPL